MAGMDEKEIQQTIRQLIEVEEDAALSRFRSSRFDERLRQKIRLASAPPGRPSFFRAIPRPAWISLAFFVLLGGILLTFRDRPTAADGGQSVEAALRRMPVMRDIEAGKGSRPVSGLTSRPESQLEKKVAVVLSFRKDAAGSLPTSAQPENIFRLDPRKAPIGLKDFYQILIINKSVERVLTGISPVIKEG